jgi:hypothetical protein
MEWFTSKGADLYLPLGHSRDADLIADLADQLLRIQVKTCTCRVRGRWRVTLCTRGGNQSWNGLVKRLDSTRCDLLFVVVGDGRRWSIPAGALGGGSQIVLGGHKYAEYEVEPGRPLPPRAPEKGGSTIVPS